MSLDIESIFSYHAPSSDAVGRLHENVRNEMKFTAYYLNAHLPNSPEKTLAIRHLQMAMMFANSAIAQYGVNNGKEE